MKRGFTLIELLVVITLIGILMGIALVSYQATRKTARDGKRKADLEQVRSALEIYRSDCGRYPNTGKVPFGTGSLVSGEWGETCPSGTVYMAQVPQDPLYSTYKYRYTRGGYNSYMLCAYLEGGTVTTACTQSCGGDCDSGKPCNYKLCQP